MMRWSIKGCLWACIAAVVLAFAVFCFYLMLLYLGDRMENKEKITEYTQDDLIIWIPTGLVARMLGVSCPTVAMKYGGSIRRLKTAGGQDRWSLEDVQKLVHELRR